MIGCVIYTIADKVDELERRLKESGVQLVNEVLATDGSHGVTESGCATSTSLVQRKRG